MAGPRAVAGVRHLAVLAREPRPAGGDAETRARRYAADVLRDAGFQVRAERFEYSALPGRFGTPLGALLLSLGIATSAWLALRGAPRAPLMALVAALLATGLLARLMLRDGVLDLPLLRAASENLVATRGGAEPRVWLVAHLDSKSQPVPSAARVIGISLLALAALVALGAALLQLGGTAPRTAWWAALVLLVLGAPAVMGSVVGSRSAGAVDNASGVAAVLEAAALVPDRCNVGVLLPSAEELGLAGARAWAGGRAAGTCLNCDGVDDEGSLTVMYSGPAPSALLETLRAVAPRPPRVRRMPLGLLTDSVAFADRGWAAVTVSRGSLATLGRVHTIRDSLDHLRGDGIADVALFLARGAEALA